MEANKIYIIVACDGEHSPGMVEFVGDVFVDRAKAEEECKRLDYAQYTEFLEAEAAQWEGIVSFEDFKKIRPHLSHSIIERDVVR